MAKTRHGSPAPVEPADRELVTELAGLVVGRLAPDELPVLPIVAEDYFADPAGTLHPRDRDQPLGFGMDLALLGPYALAVATPVVNFLVSLATDIAKDIAKDMTKDAVQPAVRDLVRRMMHRDTQPEPILLTPQQLQRVQDSSYENALAFGLPEAQARLLADALGTSVNRRP